MKTVCVLVGALLLSACQADGPAREDSYASHREAMMEKARECAPRAGAMFHKLKSLEGTWMGKSTKGWEESETIRAIAGGSAVLETSFDAHPGETMLVVYHMDGPDRLMLTHYCVAKNQPRLIATHISEDLNEATFAFLDATNLPTRDKGHMDKCAIRFEGPDRCIKRWTWYQEGKEDWMEEIVNERKKGP